MKDLIKSLFEKYKIPITDKMLQRFDIFYNLVIEENQKYNLTAITEKKDFAIKHILDCCLASCLFPEGATVIDIGAGAGFPSIPLKIVRPDLNITMLDSLNKRVNFLNMCIEALDLKDIKAVHSRAEDYVKEKREKYDIATARAVANLSSLSEYCLPYVKVGGKFIALKGSAYAEELEQAKNAINLLGGSLEDIQKINIPELEGKRGNIVIKKIAKAPSKYPRGKNQPRLKPL